MSKKITKLTTILFLMCLALQPCSASTSKFPQLLNDEASNGEQPVTMASHEVALQAQEYNQELENISHDNSLTDVCKAVHCRDLAENLQDLREVTTDALIAQMIDDSILRALYLAQGFYTKVDVSTVESPSAFYEEVADFYEEQMNDPETAACYRDLQSGYDQLPGQDILIS